MENATLLAPADERTTAERLWERYHTYTRRASTEDPKARRMMFRAFERSLGEWLPACRETPILDIACGEGSLLRFLRSRGYTNLSGCDISPENVAICHSLGLDFVVRADALELGRMRGIARYGAIFAMDMLEHLPKARVAGFLEDLRVRLLPGGYAVVQTLNMGSHLGWYHRHADVTHEFGLTEASAAAVFTVAGFAPGAVQVRASWNATTPLGYLREVYLRAVHGLLWAAEGAHRPRIPTRDLLIRAEVE